MISTMLDNELMLPRASSTCAGPTNQDDNTHRFQQQVNLMLQLLAPHVYFQRENHVLRCRVYTRRLMPDIAEEAIGYPTIKEHRSKFEAGGQLLGQ